MHRLARAAAFAVLPRVLTGDRYECPVCGGRFRRMLPVRGRSDAMCPQCRSKERHRVLWLYLRSSGLLERRDVRVLHVAPEVALAERLSALPGWRYLSSDLDPGLAMVPADITDLPFRDGLFDLVLCNHVLEHVPDDRRALRELARVLAPDGVALMQHPIEYDREHTLEDAAVTSRHEREQVFGQADHVRRYGRDFGRRLAQAGFDVRIEQPRAAVAPELVERYRLRADGVAEERRADDVYVCRPRRA